MENNEEYLLRALRRTSGGLTDSLIPAHGAKLTKLVEKFETAVSVTNEVQTLIHVQGFGKCALAMEWLLERSKYSDESFGPEQFESDALLLNEKLFEAFLNQPFDMPDFSRTFEAPIRPIQHIHVSEDEFIGTGFSESQTNDLQSPEHQIEEIHGQAFAEPSWDTSSMSLDSPVPDDSNSSLNSSQSIDESPSLSESMVPDLFESSDRVAQASMEFVDKDSSERAISMAVLRVAARAAGDSARSSDNMVAQDFFDAFLKLIAYADENGKIRSDSFAGTIRNVGDRLSFALTQLSGGVTLLKNLTNDIKNPKELF